MVVTGGPANRWVSDVEGYWIWEYAGYQLLLYSLAWFLASRLSLLWRGALRTVSLFNLLGGAGMLLASQQGQWPAWATETPSGLLGFTCLVLAWRAACEITGAASSRKEQWTVWWVGTALIGFLGVGLQWNNERIVVGNLLCAYVAARGLMQIGPRLWNAGQRSAAATVLCINLSVLVALVAAAASLLAHPAPFMSTSVHYVYVGRTLMVATLCVNLLVAYMVFGRSIRALERLSESDPVTGLHELTAIHRILAYELAQPKPRGSGVAVLALQIDSLPALAATWGQETTDAVLIEVALKLRSGLSPAVALGHLGQGQYLACLTDTTPAEARNLAHRLTRHVSADLGLHPEFGRLLTLSAGLAFQGSAQHPAAGTLVEQARALCARAMQEGGDRLHAVSVQPAATLAAQGATAGPPA